MSEWPALEQQLLRSASRLYGRPWAPRLVRPVFATALAAATIVFFAVRAGERPSDERAVAPPVASGPLARFGPVAARVTARTPARLDIDRGREDGIHRGDPVVAGGALIGRVESVRASAATVMLVTDPLFSVAARAGAARVYGVAEPFGDGGLQLGLARHPEAITTRDVVYTAGTPASRPDLRSAYPAGILIGTVTHIDAPATALERVIHITPAAPLEHISDVQVLTRP